MYTSITEDGAVPAVPAVVLGLAARLAEEALGLMEEAPRATEVDGRPGGAEEV